MFWENYITLCNKIGKSPNGVCSELGFSTAVATKWKNGALPRDTTLKKISEYFNVTIEYLKGEEDKKEKDPLSNSEPMKEYVVFHRDGKNVRVKFTPEQQKVFDALVSSSQVENLEDYFLHK